MITIQELNEAIDNEDVNKLVGEVDHDVQLISLLRNRIPYEECNSVICAAEHDQIWLVDANLACEYLLKEDLPIIQNSNCFIDNDSISLYI